MSGARLPVVLSDHDAGHRSMTTITEVEVRVSAGHLNVGLRTGHPTFRASSVSSHRPTMARVAGGLVDELALELRGRDLAGLFEAPGELWGLLRHGDVLGGPLGDDAVGRAALGATVNALWQLAAQSEGVALWQLLARLSPQRLVDTFDDGEFADVLPTAAAVALLQPRVPGKASRENALRRAGYPAAVELETGVGAADGDDVAGTDGALTAAAQRAVEHGWDAVRLRMRPGDPLDADVRRALLVRDVIGPQRRLMIGAASAWSPLDAPHRAAAVAEARPLAIDDPVAGIDTIALRRVREALPAEIDLAIGAGVHRAAIFKQLLVERLVDVVRPDPSVLGGVNEVLGVLVLAARHNTPAVPTAGRVGASAELAAELAFLDYVSIGASLDRIAVVPAELLADDSRTDGAFVDRGRLLARHDTVLTS